MNIQRVSVDRIEASSNNPRKDLQPSDPEYQAIQRSLQRWSLVEPLVWNQRSGRLVSGHQRLKVLIASGHTELEVSVVDLDDSEEQALGLALNKVQGSWDDDKLASLLASLSNDGFDVTLAGFDAPIAPLPMFSPTLPDAEPLAVRQVNAADITASEQRQQDRFAGVKPIRDVICPSCGHEFGLRA